MSQQNAEIARRAYEAFGRSGVEGILSFLHPEVEWRTWEQFSREPKIFQGHQGVREVLSLFEENYDDFRAEPLEFIDAGDRVVVPVRLRGTTRGSGEPAEFELVQVWTSRDGKGARLDVYSTKSEALRAVGLSEDA